MTLGEIIKIYRKENELSMDAFSDKSGISKAYISLLEKNKHPKTGKPIAPSLDIIKMAAEAMGMDFNDLIAAIDSEVILSPAVFNYRLSKPEQVHIEKYRAIDKHGRDLVDLILDKEYDRCTPLLNAAHQRTDVTPSGTSHDEDIMDDDSEWE